MNSTWSPCKEAGLVLWSWNSATFKTKSTINLTSYLQQLCIRSGLDFCTHNVLQSQSNQVLPRIHHKYVCPAHGEKPAKATSGDWHFAHLSLGQKEDEYHILKWKKNATMLTGCNRGRGRIKRTFAAREGVRTHPSQPPLPTALGTYIIPFY